ncbi:hypothetical protein ACIQZO_32455 [Streptomyces sp. NPDC097617]|uniref:hypothetical protein n=1 Tax=Streptomyces sp. NPDC097617 TaxID=3366091 RepID=UPI0038307F25
MAPQCGRHAFAGIRRFLAAYDSGHPLLGAGAAFGIEATVHQGVRTGCREATASDTASDTALGAGAVRRGIVADPSVNLLVDAAATGDPRADRLLRERARAVGRAAALLLGVFNPAVMVVTEPASVLDEGYLREIREAATELPHVMRRSRADRGAARGSCRTPGGGGNRAAQPGLPGSLRLGPRGRDHTHRYGAT